LIFELLLLSSSILLFDNKIGFSTTDISNYYLGDSAQFIQAKSALGIAKITLPHIFAFGLFAMVLLHFLVFTKQKDKNKAKVLVYVLFTTAFLEIFSPYFIIFGATIFVYVKLFSFNLLEILFVYILWILFHSIIYD
jgi:hypothetical protein